MMVISMESICEKRRGDFLPIAYGLTTLQSCGSRGNEWICRNLISVDMATSLRQKWGRLPALFLAHFSEKRKNLATKQDIGDITIKI